MKIRKSTKTLVHRADMEHLLKHDGGPVQFLADDVLVHQLAHQDVLGLCYNVVFIYVLVIILTDQWHKHRSDRPGSPDRSEYRSQGLTDLYH